MELDFRNIEMDMLPVGMEKRTLNQSTWDPTYVVLRIRSTFKNVYLLSPALLENTRQNERSVNDSGVRLPPTEEPVRAVIAST